MECDGSGKGVGVVVTPHSVLEQGIKGEGSFPFDLRKGIICPGHSSAKMEALFVGKTLYSENKPASSQIPVRIKGGHRSSAKMVE